MQADRVERLRRWHEEASEELHRLGAHDVDYLGLDLHVPEHGSVDLEASRAEGRLVAALVDIVRR